MLWVDGVKMARSSVRIRSDVTYFDRCGFGEYWVISFRLALLMAFNSPHNQLVWGSNPWLGTKVFTSAIADFAIENFCAPELS